MSALLLIYLIGALIAAMISGRLFWKANSDSDFTVNDAVFMAIYVFSYSHIVLVDGNYLLVFSEWRQGDY